MAALQTTRVCCIFMPLIILFLYHSTLCSGSIISLDQALSQDSLISSPYFIDVNDTPFGYLVIGQEYLASLVHLNLPPKALQTPGQKHNRDQIRRALSHTEDYFVVSYNYNLDDCLKQYEGALYGETLCDPLKIVNQLEIIIEQVKKDGTWLYLMLIIVNESTAKFFQKHHEFQKYKRFIKTPVSWVTNEDWLSAKINPKPNNTHPKRVRVSYVVPKSEKVLVEIKHIFDSEENLKMVASMLDVLIELYDHINIKILYGGYVTEDQKTEDGNYLKNCDTHGTCMTPFNLRTRKNDAYSGSDLIDITYEEICFNHFFHKQEEHDEYLAQPFLYYLKYISKIQYNHFSSYYAFKYHTDMARHFFISRGRTIDDNRSCAKKKAENNELASLITDDNFIVRLNNFFVIPGYLSSSNLREAICNSFASAPELCFDDNFESYNDSTGVDQKIYMIIPIVSFLIVSAIIVLFFLSKRLKAMLMKNMQRDIDVEVRDNVYAFVRMSDT